VLGAKVINSEREDLGKIEDIVLDAWDNRAAYAILSFGGFLGLGDKHIAIPWEALSYDLTEKVAVLGIDRDRLRNAPGFNKDDWPNMADPVWGSQIYRHYGYEPHWEDTTSQSENSQQAR
jgi:hypothetical protein